MRLRYHFFTISNGAFIREFYDLRVAKREARKVASAEQRVVFLHSEFNTPSGNTMLKYLDVYPDGRIVNAGSLTGDAND